ncbi:hypothetical protein [Comamonas suwonensis]|uniref:hypothetical protein n=1 Tax=Comamonas suwonensis TaxID=2606214 RepID=UPI00145C9570|nr:hypothetical protein [Comamonas suwonensis]MBI1624772.1 hypothetical protein [Comamonas suwonensis]
MVKSRKKNRPVLEKIAKSAAGADAGFMRAELYTASKAMGVLGEAGRLGDEFVQHLALQNLEAKPPVVLQGAAPNMLRGWLREHALRAKSNIVFVSETIDKNDKFKAAHERSQATSIPTLMGVVAGYPGAPNDNDQRYLSWKELVLVWARRRWGSHILAVYEHVDEAMGHLHIIVAKPDARSVRDLHPGAAKQDQKLHDLMKLQPPGLTYRERENACKKGARIAYEEGCRELQDEYFSAVSEPIGMQRCADKSWMRYGYKEALLRKRLNSEVSDLTADIDKREKEALEREDRNNAIEKTLAMQADAQQHKSAMLLALESGIKKDMSGLALELEILEKDKADAMRLRDELHKNLELLGSQLDAVKRIFSGLEDTYKSSIFGLSELVSSGVVTGNQAKEVGSMLKKLHDKNNALVTPIKKSA